MACRIVRLLRWFPGVLLIATISLSLSSCSEEPPLKIGFVGGLTGRVADLGVAGRDGVILAIEEKNQSGVLPVVKCNWSSEMIVRTLQAPNRPSVN